MHNKYVFGISMNPLYVYIKLSVNNILYIITYACVNIYWFPRSVSPEQAVCTGMLHRITGHRAARCSAVGGREDCEDREDREDGDVY